MLEFWRHLGVGTIDTKPLSVQQIADELEDVDETSPCCPSLV